MAANRGLLHVLLVVPVWGISILNAVLAAYTAEIYPTVIRARTSGLSAGATKAGGVLILTLVITADRSGTSRTAAVGDWCSVPVWSVSPLRPRWAMPHRGATAQRLFLTEGASR
ncbi:hypothetical protein AB0J35_34000 [Nonomuraea angiospora]|uniref:hypothetical protein n=1 Tax=Nonomuraea angiospora TaxID=46172 RepID=UPI003424BFD7